MSTARGRSAPGGGTSPTVLPATAGHGHVPTLLLAVSGHGFGHAVRCAQVARALLDRGARVLVRSQAPAWLFPPDVEYLPDPGWPLDVGVVQHGGLDLDIDATRRRWLAFARSFRELVDAEARLLQQHGVDVVVADIPPLALAAAAAAGRTAIALGNFGWDWIYAAWPDFDQPLATIRAAYRQADVLLRLPLHSPAPDAFCSFRRIQDVPLIARRATQARAAVRAALGLDAAERLALLSFGGFDAAGLELDALGAIRDWRFVATPPISTGRTQPPRNVLALAQAPEDYVSLLAACDVVVTKPGYGIVADCLANQVSVLYTDRGPFREYDVLAAALEHAGRARHVPRAALLRGQLGPYLAELWAQPAHWPPLDLDGAATVADAILGSAAARRRQRR